MNKKKCVMISLGYCLNCNDPKILPCAHKLLGSVVYADFVKPNGKLKNCIIVTAGCGNPKHIKPQFRVTLNEFLNAKDGDIL